jgi:uncharacterized protein with ATP-grasp and redox domains
MIKLSTDDEEIRQEAIKYLLKLMADNYDKNAVPSILGNERGRLIAEITRCEDPYRLHKIAENQQALAILPEMEKILENTPEGERLRGACKIACLGNVIDYDIPGNNSNLKEAIKFLERPFYIDDTDKLKLLIKPQTNLLFLTDNAGEIALDTLLVQELKKIGCFVTVAVKDGPPSLNDALWEDALMVGMNKFADELITTGAKAIGIRLDESPKWFIERYNKSDIILAKGMANWETMTEKPAPCPTMYLFRTKCEPVAKSVNAPKDESIAKLVPKGWIL